jgi:hypothetical protein
MMVNVVTIFSMPSTEDKETLQAILEHISSKTLKEIIINTSLCSDIMNLRSYKEICKDSPNYPETNIDTYRSALESICQRLEKKISIESIENTLIPLTEYIGNHSAIAFLSQVNFDLVQAQEKAMCYLEELEESIQSHISP